MTTSFNSPDWSSNLTLSDAAAFEILVSSVKDYAIFMLDPSGRVATWNAGAQHIKGYAPEEILGKHFSIFYTPKDVAAGYPDQELAQAIATGRYEEEGIRLRKDQSQIWAHVTITALFDNTRKLLGFAKVTRDISDRKRREAQEHQHKLRLLDQSFDPIFTWTPGASGGITFWNKGAERVYGYTEAEALNRSSHELLSTESSAGIPEILRALDRDGHWTGELRHRAKDGRWLIVDARLSRITNPDGIVQILEANRDITERKRIESSLKSSEERLRLLVDGVKDYALMMLDRDGCVLTWYAGAQDIFGYSAEEIVGKPYATFFTAEDVAAGKPEKKLSSAAQLGRQDDIGWRLRKNGARFWANGTLTALLDEHGALHGYAKIVRDLTEVRRNEELVRSVLDHTFDSIISIDERGAIEMFNRSSEKIFGYTSDEVRGRNVSMLMPEPYAREHDDYLKSYLQTGVAKIIGIGREVEGLRKDGSRFPLELAITEFTTEFAAGRHFTGVIRDLTHRKQAEAQQSRLTAVMHATPDFVGISDSNGRAIFVNRAGRKMVGLGENEDIVNLDIDAFHDPASLQIIQKEGLPHAIKHGSWVGETSLQTRSVEKIPVWQMILAHTGAHGNVEFYSTICRDLRERRKLEQQLRHAQKMEAVGLLAGGVAHDFNNLLTVISGYSEILQDALAPSSPLHRAVKSIQEAGERAAALTQQLLAFSRQTVLEARVVDLNSIVRETARMLKRLIGEDVILETALDPEVLAVKVDPGQIGQVLMNLAVNSRDAMPTGGRLTIETCAFTFDEGIVALRPAVKPGEYVQLAMTDTGCGMDEATRLRIFEPFYTTKAPGKGTGLGLAVVHGIVNQSGGHIEVYSEPQVGTTFKIYLPAVHEKLSQSQPSLEVISLKGTETVLLVEDESAVREIAKIGLQIHGYQVLEASSGEEALKVIAGHDHPIDLLITDVIMPGMSGPELAKQVFLISPATRLIYASGYTRDAIVRNGVLEGEVAFIQKPYTPFSLLRKARAVLDAAKPN